MGSGVSGEATSASVVRFSPIFSFPLVVSKHDGTLSIPQCSLGGLMRSESVQIHSVNVLGVSPVEGIGFSNRAEGSAAYRQVMQLVQRFACLAGVGRVLHGDRGWQRMPSAGRADV